MSPLPRPCLACGTLTSASHCPEHLPKLPDLRRGRDRSHVGRGAAWDRLSKRARALQDWCDDCSTRLDLTTDHSPEAWAAIYAGRPVTLAMVSVCCRSCNARRGPAQPGSARYEAWLQESTRGVSRSEKGSRAPGMRPQPSHSTVGAA